jgi:ketosteroid isomerase-like protein
MNRLALVFASIFVFGITTLGQERAEGNRSAAREAIAAANAAFEAAHLRGDAAALAAQYTEGAQLLWEDRPIISGRKNIEAEWAKDMGGPGRKAKLTTLEVEQSGDLAYETGKFLVTAPDGKIVYDGKYICIWKRENGRWKIHRDMGNKNAPVAAAGAGKQDSGD